MVKAVLSEVLREQGCWNASTTPRLRTVEDLVFPKPERESERKRVREEAAESGRGCS